MKTMTHGDIAGLTRSTRRQFLQRTVAGVAGGLAGMTVVRGGQVRPAPPDPSRVNPRAATDFLNSIGANSAISRRGENLASTADAVRYLGLRWLRVGYESNIPVADLL